MKRGFLYSLLAAFCFGTAIPFMKIAADHVPPFFFNTFVTLTSLLLLALWYLASSDKRPWAFRTYWKTYLFLGIFSMVIPSLLATLGYRYGYAVNASVLFRFEVFAVLVFEYFMFRQRLSPRQVVGVLVGFLAVWTFVTSWQWKFLPGDLFILGAATFYALFPLMSKRVSTILSPLQINILRLLGAAPAFLVGTVLFESLNIGSYLPYLSALFIGGTVLIFVVGCFVYVEAIYRWETWKAVFVAQFLSVVFGAIASHIVFHEILTFWQWVGSFGVFLSLLLVLWPARAGLVSQREAMSDSSVS